MEKLKTPIVLHTQTYLCPRCEVKDALHMQFTALKQNEEYTVECLGHVACRNCYRNASAKATVSNEALKYAKAATYQKLIDEAYTAFYRGHCTTREIG